MFIIDILTTILFQIPIPIHWLQPRWLRIEGKKCNLIGLDRDDSNNEDELFGDDHESIEWTGWCIRCRKAFFNAFKAHSQPFDWVCKYCRQRTVFDFSHVEDMANEYTSYTQFETQEEKEEKLLNSQARDPVKRLAERLGLAKDEVVNVRRLQPIICNRCYRVRKPISRPQMILEFVSYYIFRITLQWILAIIAFPPYKISTFINNNSTIFGVLAKQYNVDVDKFKANMECEYSKEVRRLIPKSKEIQKLFKKDIIWSLVKETRSEGVCDDMLCV